MTGRQIWPLILATISGFVGGYISSRMQSVSASTTDVLRASRFELVDESGRRIGAWERDSKGRSVITFVGKDGNELTTLGLANDSPFLNMAGRDGKVCLTLHLGRADKPLLGMGDENWEGRVLLGFIEHDVPSRHGDDWGLLFRAPGSLPDLASIGTTSNSAGVRSGRLSVRSSTGKRWSVPE